MSKKIRAVAFDYDGVLVDSQPMHLAAWKKAIKEMGLDIELKHEDILGASVDEFTRSLGLDNSQTLELMNLKRKIVSDMANHEPPPTYIYVPELVKILHDSHKLAVVSQVEKKVAEYALKRHGMWELFHYYVLEGDADKPKPAPDPYLKAVEYFGLEPDEVLAVEDSPIGVESAKAAGLKVVAITNTSSKEDLEEADFIIDSAQKVMDIVGKIN